MVYVGRDTALHIPLVAMAIALTVNALHIPPVAVYTAVMAEEAEAFPVTQYRHIKACIFHSMELRLSAIAPKPEVNSRISL